MADITIIQNEITNDPLTRSYSGMTDQQVADDLNTVYRTRVRSSMSGDDVFQATDTTDWTGLTADQQNLWMSFCGRSAIDPAGASNVALVENLFGNPSTTRTNLLNIRTENISRAVELGLGTVTEGDIWDARNN